MMEFWGVIWGVVWGVIWGMDWGRDGDGILREDFDVRSGDLVRFPGRSGRLTQVDGSSAWW